jgi:hypothetical protein
VDQLPERSKVPAFFRRPSHLIIAVVVVLALIGGGLWWGISRPKKCDLSVASPRPTGVALPAPAPGTSAEVDLAGWKLTLPEAGAKGTAASRTPADSVPPWLTREDDGRLTFWAPVAGVTTPSSQHPRTELVSMNNFQAGSGPHTLTASVAVGQAPAENQDIILGQIHGAGDISSVAFVMLHYTAGAVRVVVKKQQGGTASDKYPLLSNVPLGAWFDYTISDTGDGNMTFSARYGSNAQQVTVPIPEPFRNATVRFQAGNYQQGTTSNSHDGALVTYSNLREQPSTAPR